MRKHIHGFTLIEIMIVVIIIAVLAVAAIPAYKQYVINSRRVEAKSMLLEIAGKQARFHAENNVYAGQIGDLGYGAAGTNSYVTATDSYEINITNASNLARSYEVTAEPRGPQQDDECGKLILNASGVKRVSSPTLSASECW